ncbi:hypothetical protein VB796_06605 [Arcicella sp. LKC2W]|uniref:hypothetical protein n=1 Tax=Arcicella sp. LKC2W TaxID=2984198 RepID=UPI002B20AACD|nr:hypothetical protein [Arcicella sp. LKC2W]MEA5458698.1 hypothetical protein [Arcicella sp. LKC2W]
MQTIQFGHRLIKVPTQLSELNSKQLIRYVQLINAKLTIPQFNVLMILNLLQVQERAWLKWFFFKNEYLIPFLDKLTFGLFEWTVITIHEEDFYELTLLSANFHQIETFALENPIPKIKWLVGPQMLLSNVSFRQFRKAEEFFARYTNDQSEDNLNTLLAWLYLPFWSKKASQTPQKAAKRAKIIGKLPLEKRLTIYYFYLESRTKLTKIYNDLYNSTEIDNEGTVIKKIQPIKIKMSFEKAVRILSGNINQDESTDYQYALDALSHLNDRAEEVRLLKEANEAHKQK